MRRFSSRFIIVSILFYIVYSIFSSGRTSHHKSVSQQYVRAFCHTDDDSISYRQFSASHISAENCYGQFEPGKKVTHVRRQAIEMPTTTAAMLQRCRENPYHAFYDCIWPLVHYISTCILNTSINNITIVTSSASLHVAHDNTWADGALFTLFTALRRRGVHVLDTTNLPKGNVICFASIVRFSTDRQWRPPRFGARTQPHPEQTISASLSLFRNLIVSTLPSSPRAPTGHVVVYDRGDARRRRWTNGFDFALKLNRSIGERYPVIYLWRQPISFVEQVALHSGAVALVAPHGAAFANSLFMPSNAVLMEIASRNCGEDVVHLADARLENGWTAWHAARLGLHLVPVKCEVVRDRSKLIATGNVGLVNTTIALIELSRNGVGFV